MRVFVHSYTNDLVALIPMATTRERERERKREIERGGNKKKKQKESLQNGQLTAEESDQNSHCRPVSHE